LPHRRKSDVYLRGFEAGDFVLVAGSFLLASFLAPAAEFWVTLQIEPAAALGPLALAIASVLAFLHLSAPYRRLTSFDRLQQVSAALGGSFLLEGFLSYAQAPWLLAFPVMAAACILCALLLPAWFLIYRLIFPGFPPPLRYLLVGDDPALIEVERRLASQPKRFRTAGPVLNPSRVRQLLKEMEPDQIVMGFASPADVPPPRGLIDLRLAGFTIQDAAAAYETALHRVSLGHLRPTRVLFGKLGPARGNLAMQAVYSNVAGLLALIIASPLLLLALVALKLTSPGAPAIEHQKCAGAYGIPFSLLRFQSRTWMGKQLARIGLTRLPQLLNVVRGEMALVGPRPERVEYTEVLRRCIPFYMQRLAVKPGLTGWAQVHGADAAGDTLTELEYDFYYIENVSPAFDLEIMLSSILWRSGAPRPVKTATAAATAPRA
jgi:lipopolysaccharide/colanic/teichoic acid biosynthesis glycosyltransferase